MLKRMNPAAAPKPFSKYSQAVEVPAGARWLYISGQVGATAEGTIQKGFDAQAEQCWKNIIAILAANGMTTHDLVKCDVFVTGTEYVAASRRARDTAMQGAEPASTYLVVAGLAHPDFVVEIEAVAAKA